MKRYQELAFDYADDNCLGCKAGDGVHDDPCYYCTASELLKGYETGYLVGRTAAAVLVQDLIEALVSIKGRPTIKDLIRLRRRIEKLGEEECQSKT